jgi:hypothetical protein
MMVHGASSCATLGATLLKLSVVVLADADPPLAQSRDADLTGANQPAAGRFAEGVELAPSPKSKNALASVGCLALALPALAFAEGHKSLNIAASGGKAPDGLHY